jgi:hypothetical protein
MRVFLHRNSENEYLSVNFAVAAQGFREMGWELIGYQQIESVLPQLSLEDVVVDFVDESRQALKHLGTDPAPVPTYPEVLQQFLGRKMRTSTIDTIASNPELWPVFVKPRDDSKKFTGVLVRGTGDLVGCGDPAGDTPVWCSEPVTLLREWRCFVRYGKILDVRPYKGNWRHRFDHRIIEEAVASWGEKPRGCALDFGVDEQGRTLLVEVNDGFALGAYGLPPLLYARLLSARWTELTGARDFCDF